MINDIKGFSSGIGILLIVISILLAISFGIYAANNSEMIIPGFVVILFLILLPLFSGFIFLIISGLIEKQNKQIDLLRILQHSISELKSESLRDD
jgi:hypothetical protein